jgi:hypothetical protein
MIVRGFLFWSKMARLRIVILPCFSLPLAPARNRFHFAERPIDRTDQGHAITPRAVWDSVIA